MPVSVPSPDELVRRAEAMIPRLAERAPQAERERMVPRETIEEMKEAGFFRVLQPKRWGGYEMDPNVMVDIVVALGRGCMSTAWIYGIQGVQPSLIALFDDRAGRDMWSADSSALMCSTTQPTTDVTAVEGGFRISGRWRYLSGSHYCEWAGVGGLVSSAPGAPPERVIFLLPRKDWEIVDVWDVSGLRGTGSNDIVARDAFVPDYRTVKLSDVLACRGAGQAVNTAPLYRVPFGQIFIYGSTHVVVGGLRAMFDLFLEHGATRVAVSGARTAEDPVALLLCAETANALDEIDLVRRRNLRQMHERAEAGELATIPERLKYKFQASVAVERCSVLAARIFKASGSAAIFNQRPFALMLANINAARQHVSGHYEGPGRAWGAPMLGMPVRADGLY